MSRPLLISDCDEVLLHMMVHFRDWLDEAHDIAFHLDGRDFYRAMRYRDGGQVQFAGQCGEAGGGGVGAGHGYGR